MMEGKGLVQDRKHSRNIPALLLLLFLLIAAGMTVISQNNYQRNLVEVEVIQPVKKALQYTIEYLADLQETEAGFVIRWEMEESGEYAQRGEVWVYPVYLENNVSVKGKLIPSYIKGTAYPGLWVHASKNSETGIYTMETTVEEFPAELVEAEFLMVEVIFAGTEYETVIPCSAITSSKGSTESSRVYIIEEIPKIWGTALSVRTAPIMILETNGIEAAIGNVISSDIVADIDQYGVQEGLQVKVFYREAEENEEKKE